MRPRRDPPSGLRPAWPHARAAAAVAVVAVSALGAATWFGHSARDGGRTDAPRGADRIAPQARPIATEDAHADWPTSRGAGDALRFSTLQEIRPDTVEGLEPLWSWTDARTPVASEIGLVAPIKVDETLFACLPQSAAAGGTAIVIALDAATGAQAWRMRIDATCGPLAYLRGDGRTADGAGPRMPSPDPQAPKRRPDRCEDRVTVAGSTPVALDPSTGRLCPASRASATVATVATAANPDAGPTLASDPRRAVALVGDGAGGAVRLVETGAVAPVEVWRRRLDGGGSFGAALTLPGLAFVAPARDGRLVALDVADGRALWRSPRRLEGAAAPIVFEADGRQVVAVLGRDEGGGAVVTAFVAPRPEALVPLR